MAVRTTSEVASILTSGGAGSARVTSQLASLLVEGPSSRVRVTSQVASILVPKDVVTIPPFRVWGLIGL